MTDLEEKQKFMSKNLFPEGKKSALKKSIYAGVSNHKENENQ